MCCIFAGSIRNTHTMKAGSKFSDGSQMFHIAGGDVARVQQDVNGFWGFTTKKGYNLWEGNEITKSRAKCIAILRELDKSIKYNLQFEQ